MDLLFTESIMSWYASHARDLPWRGLNSPYLIWVSEIMLQQTRIETVIPYFKVWKDRFPNIKSLAQANEQDVLSCWEGLGYYSRARNLHKAAITLEENFGGKLPKDTAMLRTLPGIGRYTAGAIASIAFGIDVPALDGNIRRVIARYFNVNTPLSLPHTEQVLWKLVEDHLPVGRSGDYNQALMDLGSGVCTPKNPKCSLCPVSDSCQSKKLGIQEERPVRLARRAVPKHIMAAGIIRQNDTYLITQRPVDGLLGGLWEFPGGKQQIGEDITDCLKREIVEKLGIAVQICDRFGVYKHAYTHFKVTLHAYLCQLEQFEVPKNIVVKNISWVPADKLQEYPMGKIDRQIARKIQLEESNYVDCRCP